MKNIIITLVLFASFTGCKKAIEQAQENLIVKAMTDGQWKVTNFVHNSTDITSEFDTYKFQYYSNRTVDAIKNGTVEITGTWDGDAATMTTWANFSNPAPPLDLINGSWHIDNSSWTFVVASQSNGSESKTMRLDKL
jgi:hypothetical protein